MAFVVDSKQTSVDMNNEDSDFGKHNFFCILMHSNCVAMPSYHELYILIRHADDDVLFPLTLPLQIYH